MREQLTLGDIGVSFLLPEKLLFCTFPTLDLMFILSILMVVDNEDGCVEYMFELVPLRSDIPTFASPSRPPSLEFSSSITCCSFVIIILVIIIVTIMIMAEIMAMLVTMMVVEMVVIDVKVTSVLRRLCVAWTPLGTCFT